MKAAVFLLIALLLGLGSATQARESDAGVWDGKSIREWVTALADNDVAIRKRAVIALGNVPPEKTVVAVPELIKRLNDKDWQIQHQAVFSLCRIGPGATAIPALTDLLANEHYFLKKGAADALSRMGPESKTAVPALLAELKVARQGDNGDGVFERVAHALGEIGLGAETCVPPLVEALQDDRADFRSSAARALGKFRQGAGSALPGLRVALGDKSRGVRTNAAQAIWRIDADSRVLPVLIEALSENSSWARSDAIEVMAEMGSDAKSCVPALLQVVEKEKPRQKRPYCGVELAAYDSACRALKKIDSVAAAKVGIK